jgi:hypothetical protein
MKATALSSHKKYNGQINVYKTDPFFQFPRLFTDACTLYGLHKPAFGTGSSWIQVTWLLWLLNFLFVSYYGDESNSVRCAVYTHDRIKQYFRLLSEMHVFKVQWLLYVPPDLTFKNFSVLSTQCIYVLCGSQNKQRLFPNTALTGWFV